jgi:ATP-dependent RNA helicase DDX55/SPB4
MPELAQIHTKMNFTPEPDVVFYKIPYEDRVREKARQARINDEERKEKITKRREEKKHKREDKKAKHEERLKQHINRKRVGRHQQILEEWDDLAKEERLYKKLKRGKISQIEHDRLMYGEHFKGKDVPKIANSDLDDLDDIE